MIKKTIKVTKTDIALGIPRSCYKCPIARAVSRAFKSLAFVDVGANVIEVNYKYKNWFADLPVKAMYFIDAFDDGRRTKPFSFTAKFYEV